MRNPGLEPGSLAALEPESSASANSASSAGYLCLSTILLLSRQILHLSSINRKSQIFNEFFQGIRSNQNINSIVEHLFLDNT